MRDQKLVDWEPNADTGWARTSQRDEYEAILNERGVEKDRQKENWGPIWRQMAHDKNDSTNTLPKNPKDRTAVILLHILYRWNIVVRL